MSTADYIDNTRAALANFLRGQAEWRTARSEEWPEDSRNAASSEARSDLAGWVVALPDSDERLQRLAAYHLGDDCFHAGEGPSRVAGRYGFGSPADPDDFMNEFLYRLFDEDNSNVDEEDRGATD